MGKSFRDGYFEESNLGKNKSTKSKHKVNRHKVKDFLKQIELDNLEDYSVYNEELFENIEE